MSQVDLVNIAKYLSSLLKIPINSSPGQPQLIIKALRYIIPDGQDLWNDIQQMNSQQQQWNQIIGFLQNQILQDGQFGFQNLDTPQIIEVYKVVIQLVHQALGEQEDQQEQQNQFNQQNNDHNNNEPQNNQTQQGSENQNNNQQAQQQNLISKQQQALHQKQHKNNIQQQSNTNRDPNLQYLASVKKQLQQKKKKSNKNQINNNKKETIKQSQKNKNKIKIKKQNNDHQKSDKKKQLKNKKSVLNVGIVDQEKKQKFKQTINNFSGKQRPKSSFIQNKSNKIQSKTNGFQLKKKNQNKISKTTSVIYQKGLQVRPPISHSRKRQNKSKNQKQKNLEKIVSHFQQDIIKSVGQKLNVNNNKVKKSQIKSNTMFRDQETTQMLKKAKRQFDYQIKDHKKHLKMQKNKKISQLDKQSTNKEIEEKQKQKLLKQLKSKQRKYDDDIVNQQLKYYYQLRDKKVSYIKHMHKLMQKLQKQRHLDLQRKQRQLQKQQKNKISSKIQQTDQLFSNNIKHLKQEYKKQRQGKSIKTNNQIKILQQMQKKLNKNKNNQLDTMKTLWQQERMKLELISKDQENMKKKLEDMYRKNRVV